MPLPNFVVFMPAIVAFLPFYVVNTPKERCSRLEILWISDH